MTDKQMGYPLPSGEAYTDDLACMMLMYPNKPEYRQALFGALDYFATWLAWERDSSKRGKDAARAWREAIEATRECIEMNACETIIGLLTDIKANTGVYCCDTGDISDGDQYTDEVEDGEGDVPQNIIDAGYADDAADWDGFADYKCMISHLMITNMLEQTLRFETGTDLAGAILGGMAAAAAIAAVILSGGGAVLVYSIAIGIATAAGLSLAVSELGRVGLGDLADDLETNHDALACAIYQADGSAAAVVALNAEIDSLFNVAQATFLKALNISAQLKALYAGRHDQQDIAEIMADKGLDPQDYYCASCGVEAAPEGTSIELVDIISIDGDGGPNDEFFTINEIVPFVDGWMIDLSHSVVTTHLYYVDIVIGPSAHWGEDDLDHRGLLYIAVRHDDTSRLDYIYGTGSGHIQDYEGAYAVGEGYANGRYGLVTGDSTYKSELEALIGGTFKPNGWCGGCGLQQDPDRNRTLRLVFTLEGIRDFDIMIPRMWWALYGN